MTTILLIRHGETVDNARQIMQGQTQGELNEQGREQARQVAERLATEPIDAVVASDLHRAIQTAEIIAAPHGLVVRTTELLRELIGAALRGAIFPTCAVRRGLTILRARMHCFSAHVLFLYI